MPKVVGLLMVVHGIAHLPGFLMSWHLARLPELPYRTTVLAGRLDVGETGTRVLGAVWLVVALAFVGLGVAVFRRGWPAGVLPWIAVTASFLLCVSGWPETRVGLLANIALAIALYWGARR